MSFKLLFSQSSPLDTTVVYGTTGHPLYDIETENSTVQKITVVRKLDLSTQDLSFSPKGGEIADFASLFFLGQIEGKRTRHVRNKRLRGSIGI